MREVVEGDSEFLRCLDERNPKVVVCLLDKNIVFRFVILKCYIDIFYRHHRPINFSSLDV